jgi:signal transduction histidine kinase
MSVTFQELLALALLAAGLLVAWIRSRGGREAKAARGRLRQLGWPLALALLTGSAIATDLSTFSRHTGNRIGREVTSLNAHSAWVPFAGALAVALVLALRPRLARRLVPVGLILLGVTGLVLARNYQADGGRATWYGILEIARGTGVGPTPKLAGLGANSPATAVAFGWVGTSLMLAQAWLFLLLGGWLACRELRGHPAVARVLLGRMAPGDAAGQPWGLLLVPLILALSVLAVHPLWSIPLLAVSVLVIRGWPRLAGQLAAAGSVAFGVLGLVAAQGWYLYGGGALAAAPGVAPSQVAGPSDALYGLVVVTNQATKIVAQLEGIALIGFGCWLLPRTFPSVGRLLGFAPDAELTRQVRQLTESRAVAVDTAASDLRRLERDLHDGAQARLVALGMSLRAAERLIPVNPDAALALVAEARDTSARALTELRELVRGVHPPVLADRGLGDAVRALALDCPLAVQTHIDLPGRLPAPVETACYFAVAELLTNAAKHSGARDARVDVGHASGMLRIEVTDFGLGGADPRAGSGLAGVEKRLAAFDGIMAISSPAGGPTIVALEVPCVMPSATA